MKLIDREKALSHPFANGQYDHKNANRDFIRGFESYKEWLEDLPTITINEEKEPVVERWYSKDGTFAKGTIDIRERRTGDECKPDVQNVFNVFSVNLPKGIETPLKGDDTTFSKNSNANQHTQCVESVGERKTDDSIWRTRRKGQSVL